jgi:hypothetical protein
MPLSSIQHKDSTPMIFHKMHSVALSELYPAQANEHSDKEHSDMEQPAEKLRASDANQNQQAPGNDGDDKSGDFSPEEKNTDILSSPHLR